MSDQETPVEEKAQLMPEEPDAPSQEHRAGEQAQQGTPPQYERVWPTTLPPFVPSTQAPYTWPMYAPGTGQQWRSGGPSVYPSYVHRPSHWPWIMLIVVLLAIFVTGGAFFLAGSLGYTFGSTSTTTQRYSVNPNPIIALNNDIGSIHVRASASSRDVTVQATKHTSWWENVSDVNVTYNQNIASNTIAITVERPGNISTFGSPSVDFDLTVPATSTLQLQTHTGSIDVSGVSGQLVLTSNTGSVEASGGTLSGNSQLLTNTGSVTFSGSIIQIGTYQFQTNTGSVNVTIPGTSVFHVDASTDTGSINITFPDVVVIHRQFTGADAHGDVGSAPQATITLRTNTGSINLNQG